MLTAYTPNFSSSGNFVSWIPARMDGLMAAALNPKVEVFRNLRRGVLANTWSSLDLISYHLCPSTGLFEINSSVISCFWNG